MATNLNVNGKSLGVEASPDTPLLWVLRDELKMTGTKYGCGVAACGTCMVHIDGQPVMSCVTPLGDVEGASITTIEGVNGAVAAAVQAAWRELNVVQCGFCQSGQIMSAISLLSENANPTVEQIDNYMWGNACRCATYQRIRAAVQRASKILEA